MFWVKSCLLLISATMIFSLPKFRPPKTLSEDELNMLHADAVMAGTAGKKNIWFDAIDAGLLDDLITEMNAANKWFAKIVKYWDEFTSGRDGREVFLENQKGESELGEEADEAIAEEIGQMEDMEAGGEEAAEEEAPEEGEAAEMEGEEGAEEELGEEAAEEEAGEEVAEEEAAGEEGADEEAAAEEGEAAEE